ncbi:response regulator [Klebsiella pneumoniae]|nr:response regulator [Klebsiella pneumoniae]
MVCESLASILQGIFQVEYTSSPERALEKLRRKPYDLVLSDLQMPIMNGDELYMAVKQAQVPTHKRHLFSSALTPARVQLMGLSFLQNQSGLMIYEKVSRKYIQINSSDTKSRPALYP